MLEEASGLECMLQLFYLLKKNMLNSLDDLWHGREHKIFPAHGMTLEMASVSDSKQEEELGDESPVWNRWMLSFWKLPWT